MCRLYGFRSTAPTRLDCSFVRTQNALLKQSRLDARGRSNADGWGIGYFEDGRPVVEKSDAAAYEDPRFNETADGVNSLTVLAHVRQATVGGARLANSHPFAHGVWALAHNGTLTAFDRVAPGLEQEIGGEFLSKRRGTTDSELIFLWLLDRMRQAGIKADKSCEDSGGLTTLFAESVALLAAKSAEAGATEPAKLNLLLTDGVTLVASRWGNTLFRLARQGVRNCELCGSTHVEERHADGYRAAVVASEPITKEKWLEVPEHSVVTVGEDAILSSRPIR